MKITYNSQITSQNIDIGRLRPNGSYDNLIKNRNGAFTDILSDHSALKEFLNHRPCPTCSRDGSDLVATKDNLDIVECKHCNQVFVNPIFDEIKYQDLYQADEYVDVVKALGEASHNYRRDRFGTERAKFINDFHTTAPTKRYLDIGCSTGFTLEALAELGWNCEGIELNPSAAHFGRDRGLRIHTESIENYSPDYKFGAISLFDVLEHLAEPKIILNKVRDLLDDGGNLFIYVPNWNSASREILGIENAHFIWPSHHLTYYTPETLKYFLENSGFEILFWETQGLDLFDTQWFLESSGNGASDFLDQHIEALQFYVNASGHGKNLRMFAKKRD